MVVRKTICPACGQQVVPNELFKQKVDSDYIIRGACPVCGKYLGWLKYADSVLVKKAIKHYAELPENKGLRHEQ